MFGDDLPKTFKDIREDKQSQLIFDSKIPAYTKTGNVYQNREVFFIQKPGVINKEEDPDRMFNHIRLTNKGTQNIGSTRTHAKPLAPDFQIQVSELVHKIKFLNEKFIAGSISEHINNWKGLTSDK